MYMYRSIRWRSVDLYSDNNGKGEDSDTEDRQLNEPASDVLEEEEWVVEEGQGAGDPLRCRSWIDDLLQHRQTP